MILRAPVRAESRIFAERAIADEASLIEDKLEEKTFAPADAKFGERFGSMFRLEINERRNGAVVRLPGTPPEKFEVRWQSRPRDVAPFGVVTSLLSEQSKNKQGGSKKQRRYASTKQDQSKHHRRSRVAIVEGGTFRYEPSHIAPRTTSTARAISSSVL